MNGDTQEAKGAGRWSLKRSLAFSTDEICSICKAGFSFSSPKKTCIVCKSAVCILHSRKRFEGETKQQVCDYCAFPDINSQFKEVSQKESATNQEALEILRNLNIETQLEIQEMRKAELDYKMQADADINRNREQVGELKTSLNSYIRSQEMLAKKIIAIQKEIRDTEIKIVTDRQKVDSMKEELIALSLNKDHSDAHFDQLADNLENLHKKVVNSVPASIIGPKLCEECQTKIFGSAEIVKRSFVMESDVGETTHSRQSHCNECLLL
jgi:hypothetical protein